MDRVTLAEAARRLGVKENAVRKRVQRGSLKSDKGEDGRVYVYLEPDTEGRPGANTVSEDAVARMADHIKSLEAQLEYMRRESERKDTILLSMTEGIKALEAPREAPDAPEPDTEGTVRGAGPSEPQEPTQRRSWWRAFFGLE